MVTFEMLVIGAGLAGALVSVFAVWSAFKQRREVIGQPSFPEGEEPVEPRAEAIDRLVGSRIRERRIMLGLTEREVADLIGATDRQTHQFESGIRPVSAGRLYQIAQALGVDISYFFGDARGRPRQKDPLSRDSVRSAT